MQKILTILLISVSLFASINALALRVCYPGLEIEYNYMLHIPEWSRYTLTPEQARAALSAHGARKGLKFWRDWNVDGSVSPANYRRSGYDMGHLAPAADLPGNHYTFSTVNIAPQNPRLNRTVWRMIELRVRKLAANSSGPVTITTGTLTYAIIPRTIGAARVVIPEFFFKIVQTPTDTFVYLEPNQ